MHIYHISLSLLAKIAHWWQYIWEKIKEEFFVIFLSFYGKCKGGKNRETVDWWDIGGVGINANDDIILRESGLIRRLEMALNMKTPGLKVYREAHKQTSNE